MQPGDCKDHGARSQRLKRRVESGPDLKAMNWNAAIARHTASVPAALARALAWCLFSHTSAEETMNAQARTTHSDIETAILRPRSPNAMAFSRGASRFHRAPSGCKALLDRVPRGMILYHTTMPKTKVALTLDAELLEQVDELVAKQRFRNRSQAVEAALADKLHRLARTRLARESANLNPREEKRLADEGLADALESWPEY